MLDYEFKQTTHGQSMEKAFDEFSTDPGTEDALPQNVRDIIRKCFVEVMTKKVSRSSQSEKNLTILSTIDPTKSYPCYQTSEDYSEIYLKDAEIIAETQLGKERYHAEYVKLNIYGEDIDEEV